MVGWLMAWFAALAAAVAEYFIFDELEVFDFIYDDSLLFGSEFTELSTEPKALGVSSPKQLKQSLNTFLSQCN
tara:strand:- start:301 stop:519 length:219 start_codon:yes stop_codon:yes gene_type:complete